MGAELEYMKNEVEIYSIDVRLSEIDSAITAFGQRRAALLAERARLQSETDETADTEQEEEIPLEDDEPPKNQQPPQQKKPEPKEEQPPNRIPSVNSLRKKIHMKNSR